MEGVDYKQDFMNWNFLVALFSLVILISFVGRLSIANIPYGGWHEYNEANYAGAARNLLWGKGRLWAPVDVNGNEIFQVTPLSIYLLYFFFKLFGVSEFSSRLVPIIFSTGSVFVLLAIGRLVFNRYIGILAATFLAVNGIFNIFGFNVQTEPVFVFFILISFYYYLRSIKEDKFIYFLISGLLSGIGVFAKQTAILMVIVVTITEFSRTFIEKVRLSRALGRIFLFGLLSVSVSLPWLIHNYLNYGGMKFIRHLDGDVTLGKISLTRAVYFFIKTFNPLHLPFIIFGMILNLRKNVFSSALISWVLAFFCFICFKNPHMYYILPLVGICFLLSANAIYTLFNLKRFRVFKLIFGFFILFLVISSLLITYKRFLNRKIGFNEYKILEQYCNSDPSRVVFTLSQVYIVEKFYVRPSIRQLNDIEEIERERKTQNVYVVSIIAENKIYNNLLRKLSEEATSVKTISQDKYNFFLKKITVPVLKVYKFDKTET